MNHLDPMPHRHRAVALAPAVSQLSTIGAREHHEYELYLAVENIDHSRTKARHPQTNGIYRSTVNLLLEKYSAAASAGGASVCAQAGIPVAGGHSIDSPEPIYGLVALGIVDPDRVMRNSAAQAGDRLILTKRLGIGIYSAALKRQVLDERCYAEMLASTTQLNAPGAELPDIPGVHAVTDVTGFGLLGHLLEMCRASFLGAEIEFGRVPVFPGAQTFAQKGIGTGASTRNWASYGHEVDLPAIAFDWQRTMLCDPQTSGGLLIACSDEAVPQVLDLLARRGFEYGSVIGSFNSSAPRVRVDAIGRHG